MTTTGAAANRDEATRHGDETTRQVREVARLDAGRGSVIPGWVLRAALAAAAVTAVGIVLAGTISPLSAAGVLALAAAVGVAFAPGGVLPLLLLATLVIYRLVTIGAVVDVELLVLAALMPLIHQLASLAAVIPAGARVEPAALRPAAIRYLWAVAPFLAAGAIWIALS